MLPPDPARWFAQMLKRESEASALALRQALNRASMFGSADPDGTGTTLSSDEGFVLALVGFEDR
jgi:hypothetical protein